MIHKNMLELIINGDQLYVRKDNIAGITHKREDKIYYLYIYLIHPINGLNRLCIPMSRIGDVKEFTDWFNK